jgi:Flp pilus assembly protein TadG
MNKYTTSTLRKETGQSLTEFALVLVFLLALLAGVFDIGRAFFAYIIIRDAAQEGAVFGSIAPKHDIPSFKTAVANRVEAAYLDPSDPSNVPIDTNAMNVQVDIIGSPCAAPGNSVRVSVDYSLPVVMPFLGALIGQQDIQMSSQVEDSILSPICP